MTWAPSTPRSSRRRTYREIVKPLHAEIVSLIKRRSKARFFLHSCGAIRDLIPDLIDIGVDALNPVQVSADGMDTATLKAEFGRDITLLGWRRRPAARACARDARRGPGGGSTAHPAT